MITHISFKVLRFISMSKKLIIEGGVPLRGEFQVSGAKNAALKLMVTSLLTEEEVVINNVPRISDIEAMLENLKFLGARADWVGEHTVRIKAETIISKALPTDLAKKTRASFLIFGALLARVKEAVLPSPGGDKIGRRPVNRHLRALQKLGVRIKREDGYYHGTVFDLVGNELTFKKNTHTGTENAILTASKARGLTILKNAAAEPEIDNLIHMLNLMGAKIRRREPRVIEIEGVERLRGTDIDVIGDRNEAMTVATAALITHGEVRLKGIDAKHLTALFPKLDEVGGHYKVDSEGILFWHHHNEFFLPTQIETSPYPGFMCDWLPPFVVLLTQADGISIIHETIYPNRLSFTQELKKMGAEARLFRPEIEKPDEVYNFDLRDDRPEYFHAAEIFGPTPLVGTKVSASDIRAGAALVLAGLIAKGRTEISEIDHIERGYEDIIGRLKNLGARIKEESLE